MRHLTISLRLQAVLDNRVSVLLVAPLQSDGTTHSLVQRHPKNQDPRP